MRSPRKGALAVIPARGGSKGFPGKNLAKLGGKTLLARTIAAALGAKTVGRVVVTTDSPAIAREARRAGAEVPFMRPAALSRDQTPVVDALRHAVDAVGGAEIVVLLQPTSPLRGSARIDQAVRLVRGGRADTAVGVCEPPVHPWQCVKFSGARMKFAVPRPKRRVNRQDYPEVYALNGALYVTRGSVLAGGGLYGKRVLPVVMDAWESVDVDEPGDLALAAFYLTRSGRRG